MSNFHNQIRSKLKEITDTTKIFPREAYNNKSNGKGENIDKEETQIINNSIPNSNFIKRQSQDYKIENPAGNSSNNDSKVNLINSSQKNNVFQKLNSYSPLQQKEGMTNLNKITKEDFPDDKLNRNFSKKSCSSSDSNSDGASQIKPSISSIRLNKNNFNTQNESKKVTEKNFSKPSSNKEVTKNINIEIKKLYVEDNNAGSKKNINELNDFNFNNKYEEYEVSPNESERTNQKNNFRKLMKREKICDSDTEDEGCDNEKETLWVIMPDNSYKRVLDIIIAIIIIYSAVVLPYKIAFSDSDGFSDEVIDNVFNGFLVIDIIVNFFAAYVDGEENIVKNRKKIVRTYLQSWFIVDLVSVLPMNYLTDSPQTTHFNALARLSRLPKLYRLVRLTKLFRMVKILKKGNVNKVTKYFLEKLKVNANIERLIYFILAFLLLNHLAACIWFFVAKLEDLNPDCWVTRLGYIDASNAEIYIVSFYWTLTTVTTVGYGDINAGTTVERIYNLFIMSFGVLMYSFAIGSLSSIVSTLDAKTAEMNQKLQILSSIKKEFSLDQEIYDKVRKVIKYDLSRNQKDKMNFLQELPNKLRIELSQIMHDSVIQKMYFFKDQPSDFIAYVAPLLKPVKFSQKDFLYKEGDMIDEMYFVSKGTVSFCLGKNYNEKEIKEIKKHNNFGEIEMCLNEKLSFNIKVKSRNCELFVLKKNDFLRLSVNFKEFIEKFLQRSLMIYLRFNEEKRKIIREIEELNNMSQSNKNNILDKNEALEMIDEKEDEEGSEVYDIFGDHYESENTNSEVSDKDSKLSGEEKKNGKTENEHDKENGEDKKSLFIFNSFVKEKSNPKSQNNDVSPERNILIVNNNDNEKYDVNNQLETFLDNKNRSSEKKETSVNKNLNVEIVKSPTNKDNNVVVNEDHNIRRNSKLVSLANNINLNMQAFQLSGGKLVDKMENDMKEKVVSGSEAPDNVEKLKSQMNKKFIKKVEKIIEFLEKNKVEMDTEPDSPNNIMNLLKRLKTVQDLTERNEIIDKIESIVTDIFNKLDKK